MYNELGGHHAEALMVGFLDYSIDGMVVLSVMDKSISLLSVELKASLSGVVMPK